MGRVFMIDENKIRPGCQTKKAMGLFVFLRKTKNFLEGFGVQNGFFSGKRKRS